MLTTLIPLVVLAQGPTKAPESALPVRAVTLFSSGVAYTQREGEVSDNATVPLMFRTTQINDILKSLVLIDEKGKVQPAVYAAKDPVNRTLQSFAVDVTQPLDRNALLSRLRGQVVRAYTQDGSLTTGKLVSVEAKTLLTAEGKSISVEFLNLLTESGLNTQRLDLVWEIAFEDPKVAKEFGEALTLLATGADDKRRSVTLRFEGQGKRKVQVGYISEAPLWKMSYRLLLGEKSYMQGWALVENTTDEDWNGVSLTLVSGRPISFIQDLYQPQYLARPVLGADLTVSPLPQLAEGAMEFGNRADVGARAAIRNSVMRGQMGGQGGSQGQGGFPAPAPVAEAIVDSPAMISSVGAQASGEKQGELFTYKITSPVALPRQQAAMIPVVAQDIHGEKISLYNVDTDARFPLHAVRLKNNTGLHLKGGPVTLFDGGIYAGDARMLDIPPGDSRILSYAVDLGLRGERQDKGSSSVETSLSIKRGVLTSSRKETVEVVYNFRNTSDKPRQVLVEHPFDSAYKLVAPAKFEERTSSLYRFLLPVPAGKTETLTVKTERPLAETYALLDADINFIELTTQRKEGLSPKLKAALEDILTRRRKLQEIQSQIGEHEAEVKQIEQDQSRIRQNMMVLDRNSESYKNYVKQLDEQELRIQALRKQTTELRAQLATQERDLRAFVDKLDV
jgi:flagellar biosynthesis chaperone FliJ